MNARSLGRSAIITVGILAGGAAMTAGWIGFYVFIDRYPEIKPTVILAAAFAFIFAVVHTYRTTP